MDQNAQLPQSLPVESDALRAWILAPLEVSDARAPRLPMLSSDIANPFLRHLLLVPFPQALALLGLWGVRHIRAGVYKHLIAVSPHLCPDGSPCLL